MTLPWICHPGATDSAVGHVSFTLLHYVIGVWTKAARSPRFLTTKVWAGLPMIFPLHLLHLHLHNQKSVTRQHNTSTHVLTLQFTTYPAYL